MPGSTVNSHTAGDALVESARGVPSVTRRVVAGEHVCLLVRITVTSPTPDRGVRPMLLRRVTTLAVVHNVVTSFVTL